MSERMSAEDYAPPPKMTSYSAIVQIGETPFAVEILSSATDFPSLEAEAIKALSKRARVLISRK